MGKKIMLPVFLLVFLYFNLPLSHAEARSSSSQQKLDVRSHLNRLNKPPVKSIESPDGDIIDCIHINHQPAYDHPLLKDHKIQTRPIFHPEGHFNEKKVKVSSNFYQRSETITQLWHLNGRCPEETIPVRRTKEDDISRASSVERFGRKKHHYVPKITSVELDSIGQTDHQHAVVYVEGGKYYGARATMNVWKPKVEQPNEFSLTQIWVLGGAFNEDMNSIEAGWQVNSDLYGDNRTRLFTYWTSDAYETTGCYNLLCSGFVQTSNHIAMGATIYPVSSYGGSQFDINLLVWKDPASGNWWIQYGKDELLGYWPASLFTYLAGSANTIEWGGEIVNSKSNGQHTTTQMGSGHFSGEGFGRSAYFKKIETVDESNALSTPRDLLTFAQQPTCYDVKHGHDDDWGSHFFFGGPGRNPNCP